MKSVPSIRIRVANDAPVNQTGGYVLYWMIANRRAGWNFALDRAVDMAAELKKPLVVLEPLRAGYNWASERFHSFILEGMEDNRRIFEEKGVCYHPYLEPGPGEGRGLLYSLAKRACLVVTDEFPCFFIPGMVEKTAARLAVRLEVVDSAGLLPLRASDRVFPTAYSFRRFLQKRLPLHLHERPRSDPFDPLPAVGKILLPPELTDRWPPAGTILEKAGGLSGLPVNHKVGKGPARGGAFAADHMLERFISRAMPFYDDRRNEPEEDFTSGLSPYLHFGHISSHQVFDRVRHREDWFFDRISHTASGSRSGWWGMSAEAEAFLDQMVTWRELGFNMCALGTGWDRYDSLPGWALKTLKDHEKDPRTHLYRLEEFEKAETHDPLWNAAQTQLVTEGRMHGYIRMLWGKKILEWTESPREALEVMIELNNKYALDGRDPNSYSGIFWILGRYDRAWGPERPVFGKIRYMSSANTARKVPVKGYIERYR